MNNMHKITVGAFAFVIAASPTFAVGLQAESRIEARVDLKDAKDEVKDARKDLMEVRKDIREDLKEKVASRVGAMKKFFQSKMSIVSGKITAINGTTITVEKDGTSYTVLTGTFDKCTTRFRRRFWGNSGLSEYAVGHMVNVFGRWKDDTRTSVEACVLRDISIQKRFGVFVGNILSLTTDGWVMTTASDKRTNQTVTITSETKLVNRNEAAITRTDIKVGDKVRVKGMWDRSINTVTEVTHVKDYSLPLRVTPTP